MAVVMGADGCPGHGWVVAEVADADTGVTWHHTVGMEALLRLAEERGAAALAVDVPIGLPGSGPRTCDTAARALLQARGSSVFPAPARAALRHTTYGAARPEFPSLSAQSFALVSRIRDVDDALRVAGPSVHGWVFECHPEVSLRELTGVVLPAKKSAPGALLRLAALRQAFGELPVDAPPQAGLDDALDALACAWTARRWVRGEHRVLGGEPDATGVPMRIVV